jgi:hypothetical protein
VGHQWPIAANTLNSGKPQQIPCNLFKIFTFCLQCDTKNRVIAEFVEKLANFAFAATIPPG